MLGDDSVMVVVDGVRVRRDEAERLGISLAAPSAPGDDEKPKQKRRTPPNKARTPANK